MARERIRRQELDAAETCYRTILARAPIESAQIGLAQVLAERGNWPEAEVQLKTLAQSGPSAQAFLTLARLQSERGEDLAASESLAQARRLFPEDLRLVLAHARHERAMQRAPSAEALYQHYIDCNPSDIDARLERVTFLEQIGEFDRAQPLFRDIEVEFAEHPSLLAAQGRAAHTADNLHEARAFLERCLALDPGRITVHHTLARILVSLGEVEAAFRQIDTIESLTGPRSDHEYLRAEQSRRLGYLEQALAVSGKARADFPADIMVWSQFAIINIDLGHFDVVRDLLAQAPLRSRTDEARRDLIAGALALAEWRTLDAAADFARAREVMPTDRWLIDRIVQCDLVNLELEAAKTHLRERGQLNITTNRRRHHTTNWSQNFLGQLFNEYRMDDEAVEAMKRLVPVADEAGLEAFRPLVEVFPDNTAVALEFLVGARRAGLLAGGGTADKLIPARIAQFWDSEALPPDIADYCASWRDMNPDFAYHRFTAQEAKDYLAAKSDRATLQAFSRAREPAMKADLFRLAYLLNEGGFYTDADDRCQRPLAALRQSGGAFIAYQEDLGSVGNNFMAVVPQHPVVRAALVQAVDAIRRGDEDVLWLSTGPGLITRAIVQHACDAPTLREGLAGMTILARHEMLHYAAIHCATSYKHTNKHWSRSAFNAQRPVGNGKDRADASNA